MTKYNVAATVLVFCISSGCKQESQPERDIASVKVKNTTPSQKPMSNTKVSKIVFIGQKDACECTLKRVNSSMAALEEALGDRGDIPVEKLNLDVDQTKAERYQKLKPILVPPAIYLLDSSGGLVEMLQGEITPDQLLIAMGG